MYVPWTFLFFLLIQIIFTQQDVQDGDNMPERKNQTCLQSSIRQSVKLSKNNGNKIVCGCKATSNQSIVWFDENCKLISNSEKFVLEEQSLKVAITEENNHEWNVHCTDKKNCSYIIRVTPDKEEITGLSTGLQIFLILLILSIVLVAALFIYKKYKLHIFLSCRDACSSQADRDGKEFDAYLSIGKNTNDLKFVERNITDTLQRRHGYKFYVDEENLLPQLEFSEKVKSTMHKCRRLVVVFTPSYMTNDWCMYCFSEGLRKLLELKIKLVFIITDVTIEREINSLSSLVGNVPQVFISYLPIAKNKNERNEIVRKIRLLLPPSKTSLTIGRGMRTPMLSEVEEIDERSTFTELDPSKEVKYIALETTSTNLEDDFDTNAASYDGTDPNSIKVHHYKAKKDFYSITAVDLDDD